MTGQSEITQEILAELNEQQQLAVSHGFEPLLIIAGAGTGKTTTLANRVAYLIATGVDPSRILLVTFTRRASAEMLRRVESILTKHAAHDRRISSRRVWGGTFHAIATRLLRKHGKLLGIPPEFTIMDRSDSADMMQMMRAELNLNEAEKKFPVKTTCLSIYSKCLNTQKSLESVLQNDFPWCIEHQAELKKVFDGYVDRKEDQALLDYDDLLLFWDALLQNEQAGRVLRDQFDCVLVDEYQDTNTIQASILRNLKPDGTGLTVVGDDAQSIYAFRGATVRNILDFPEEFPGTTLIKLEENYRSTQPILDVTNHVIGEANEGHQKTLYSARTEGSLPALVECMDEDEETEFLIDEILEATENGMPLKEQAVLFRSSYQCMMLETELTRRGIPFQKYGGMKFIETAHVKDLLAFLRLAENPRDQVSGLRVLPLLPGIGAKTAQRLLNQLSSPFEGFTHWKEYRPPAKARELWPEFVQLMNYLAAPGEVRTVAQELHAAYTFYAPILESKYDQANARLRDLQQLEQVAARFPDRSTFLTEIAIDPPSSTVDIREKPPQESDYLILSTIHSAKGLEWDTVYVLQACDGSLPSARSMNTAEELEEERRLFYVAMTRAKNRLFLMHPQRLYFQNRQRGDSYGYAPLTRFLSGKVHASLRTIFPGEEETPITEEGHRVMSSSEIRNRMKDLL